MGAAKSDDLFPDLRNPEGTRVINERCIIKTQDEHRVVLVSGIALAQYSLIDRMAEAYAMVNLVEQGWATQQDVARGFDCSARTVRRDQRRFEDGGLAALGHFGGYPEGRRRLSASRTGWINRLKAGGHSNREIARRAGVSEMAIRKMLRGLGWKETPSQPDLIPAEEVAPANPNGISDDGSNHCQLSPELRRSSYFLMTVPSRGAHPQAGYYRVSLGVRDQARARLRCGLANAGHRVERLEPAGRFPLAGR